MKKYYWLVTILLVSLFILQLSSLPVEAAARSEVDSAEELYVAAASCVAAYNDKVGFLALKYLQESGWIIKPFVRDCNTGKKYYFIAFKRNNQGKNIYLLSFRGTDGSPLTINADLKLSLVPYNAKKDNGEAKVHRGFDQYAQQAVNYLIMPEHGEDTLLAALKRDPHSRLIITGHSLGGAAATILAARLVDKGINPQQIRIITFGAPAVGNDEFKRQYEQKLQLSRVVAKHDLIPTMLSKLNHKYAQFGVKIPCNISLQKVLRQHQMKLYLDYAINNYYNVKSRLIAKNTVPQRTEFIIMPVNMKGKAGRLVHSDTIIADIYAKMFAGNTIFQLPRTIHNERLIPGGSTVANQNINAEFVVFTELDVQDSNSHDITYVTLSSVVVKNKTNKIVRLTSYSSVADKNLSILQAFIHNCYKMLLDYKQNSLDLLEIAE